MRETTTEGQALAPLDYSMDDSTLREFSYTINIAPFKHIKGLGKWGHQTSNNQKGLLRCLINDGMKASNIDETYIHASYYNVELTNKNNWHVHGKCVTTDYRMNMFQMFLHKKCGFPRSKVDRVLMYECTKVHISYWDKYRNKDYDDDGDYVPNYNMFISSN